MRCVLLLLVLSTFVFCDDVHIHTFVQDLTGWSEAEAKTMDQAADDNTDSTGHIDKTRYDERLKYQHNALWVKVVKFRQTAARVRNENQAASDFMDSALTYAVQTRYGHIREDEASKKVVQDWDNLPKDSRTYLMTNFPAIQHFSHFVGKF